MSYLKTSAKKIKIKSYRSELNKKKSYNEWLVIFQIYFLIVEWRMTLPSPPESRLKVAFHMIKQTKQGSSFFAIIRI